MNYLMEPQVIAAVTDEIHYGNDNSAADRYVDPSILHDPTIYPTPQLEARLYPSKEVSASLERLRTRIWMKIKTGI
jgi:putrescine transport system substrate-binding protein